MGRQSMFTQSHTRPRLGAIYQKQSTAPACHFLRCESKNWELGGSPCRHEENMRGGVVVVVFHNKPQASEERSSCQITCSHSYHGTPLRYNTARHLIWIIDFQQKQNFFWGHKYKKQNQHLKVCPHSTTKKRVLSLFTHVGMTSGDLVFE